MGPRLATELRRVLLRAYEPCLAFSTVCHAMRWKPESGHVPRGFCGATGHLEDVRLVVVVAEPGDPYASQVYTGSPEDMLDSAYIHAHEYLRSGKDLFHRNLLYFLRLCWPEASFENIMRLTWITESVLCSAEVECGRVPTSVARECRKNYLAAELALLPLAVVVALGGKAQYRLKGLPEVIPAHSVAPPGCNQPRARESWEEAARQVRKRVV